jgi:hypothetical protein
MFAVTTTVRWSVIDPSLPDGLKGRGPLVRHLETASTTAPRRRSWEEWDARHSAFSWQVLGTVAA